MGVGFAASAAAAAALRFATLFDFVCAVSYGCAARLAGLLAILPGFELCCRTPSGTRCGAGGAGASSVAGGGGGVEAGSGRVAVRGFSCSLTSMANPQPASLSRLMLSMARNAAKSPKSPKMLLTRSASLRSVRLGSSRPEDVVGVGGGMPSMAWDGGAGDDGGVGSGVG